MAAVSKLLRSNDAVPTFRQVRSSRRLKEVCQRLGNNDPTLTELYMGGWRLGDNGVMALAAALAQNTHVKVLYLCYNSIGNAGAMALADMLQDNTSIEILRLEGNAVGDEGGTWLGATLRMNRTLKRVNLSKNSIGPCGAMTLARGVEYSRSLEVLDLYGNRIGNEGAKAFGFALAAPHQTLCEINLGGNNIGDDGAKELANCVATNSVLQVLDMRLNEIGNEGAEAFGVMLVMNRSLKRLWLQNNCFGANGASAIIRNGMKENYYIEKMFLGQLDEPQLRYELDIYLKLNRAGRRLLSAEGAPSSLWAQVLAGVQDQPELIFYFLQGAPHITKA